MILYLTSFLGALFVSLIFTSKVLNFLLSRKIKDHPNHRSLHSVPTPRGGGIAIVFTLTFFYIIFAATYSSPILLYVLILIPAILLALIGWLDDRTPVDARLRLIVQILVSLFIARSIFWDNFGPFLLAALFMVYFINAFNFMDGIDGIATAQTLFVSLTLLYFTYNTSPEISMSATLVAGAAIGFLYFNWQPAKLFLGDVGSTFLGLILSALLIKAYSLEIISLSTLFLLLGVFIVDTLYTLSVRLSLGKNLFKAHRDHMYQHAVLNGNSHRKVVSVVSLYNVFCLFPLALLSEKFQNNGLYFLGIGYLPLIYCAYFYGAGNSNFQRTRSNKT